MQSFEIEKQLVSKTISELPGIFQKLIISGNEFVRKYDITQCAQKYKKAIAEDYSYMQILGMERPVPLDKIYTEVRIATRIASRSFKSIDELLEEARKHVENNFYEKTKNHVKDYLITSFRKQELELSAEQIGRKHEDAMKEIVKQIAEIKKQHDAIRHNSRRSHTANIKIELEEISDQLKSLKKSLRDHKGEKSKEIQLTRKKIISKPLSIDEQQIFDKKYPIELENNLEMLARKQLHKLVSKAFSQDLKQVGNEVNAWDAVVSRNRVLILGKPGAGKTTFLKHILLKSLFGKKGYERLPVFIPLRRLSSLNKNIFDFIVDEFDTCGFPEAGKFVERVLQKSETCLILLDGLDEVPINLRTNIINDINKFSRKFRKTQIVVSCRTANYQGHLLGFTELEIVDFGTEQVDNFVNGWFHPKMELVNRFLEEIRQQPNLEELTSTPLLLAILCIAYKRNQRFPDQKASLYLMCIDALFVDWDSSRQIRRESYVEHFDVETKKQLLSKIAGDTFCNGELFFEKEILIEKIKKNSLFYGIPPEDCENIIREYTRNHGLLVERAKNIFSFSHLTFHEFFVAFYLTGYLKKSVLNKIFKELWQDAQWKEIVTFLGGLAHNADILISNLVQSAKEELEKISDCLSLLDFETPENCLKIIDECKVYGDRMVWIAWFRVHMLEYMLNIGSSYSGSFEGDMRTHYLRYALVRIGNLNRSDRHTLEMDRPLNRTLKSAYSMLPGSMLRLASNPIVQQIMFKYLRIAEVSLDIIANRARISAEIKYWAISELFSAERNKIPKKTKSNLNRLGI